MTNSERRLTLLAQAGGPAGRGAARRGHHRALRRRDGPQGRPSPHDERRRDLRRVRRADGGHGRATTPASATRGCAAEGPLQWPVPAADSSGHRAPLHRRPLPDAATAARASSPSSTPSPLEPPDARFPLTLTTGRVRDHWHTLTRTGNAPGADAPHARADPRGQSRATPGERGLQDGDFVEVTSRRGKAVAQCARERHDPRRARASCPSTGAAASGFYKSANNLTLAARDPLSHQPELKACAVRLRPSPDDADEHGSAR